MAILLHFNKANKIDFMLYASPCSPFLVRGLVSFVSALLKLK